MLVDREGLSAHNMTSMAHRQGKHMRKPLTYIFLLLIVGVVVGQHGARHRENCSKNEYWTANGPDGTKGGFCCDKCAPGFRLVKKCSSGMSSTCEKCIEGTYQDKVNFFPNCFRCQKCRRQNQVEISACTPQSNTVCGCQPGYHRRRLDIITWDCVLSKNIIN